MKSLRKIAALGLIASMIFFTGCDASKILDTISRVAGAVQQAIPAIKQVVDTVSNAVQGVSNPGSVSSPTNNPAATNNPEQSSNPAGTTVATPGDQEDLGSPSSGTSPGSLPALTRPNGRSEIERVFGARGQNQVTVEMAAGPNGATRRVTCHRLIAPRLKAVFDEIKARGLSQHIRTFDGCFNDRNKRGGTSPSTHAWGIAVDINASANPMGQSRMTEGQRQIAAVFQRYGFYQLPNDPMHFQYCTGY